jgi:putative transposase
MENFFSLLQKNVLNEKSLTTRKQLRLAIAYRIEARYHRRRLGKLTPVEFETIRDQAATLAA